MSKSEERRKAIMQEAPKQRWGFPPQDGYPAFSCEAETREEAEALYREAVGADKPKQE